MTRTVIDASDVLALPADQHEAVKDWLAAAVGEEIMRDTYEVEIVREGRITARHFKRGPDGERRFMRDAAGDLVTDAVTVDWPVPPPITGRTVDG